MAYFSSAATNYDSLLHTVITKILDYSPGNNTSNVFYNLDKQPIRARVSPKTANKSYIFAPDTVSWLESCAVNNLAASQIGTTLVYIIPLLGITNRPLAGYRKAGLNLFKTLVKISVPLGVRNLDQCTIEFGSRLPITVKAFKLEIYRQLSLNNSRIKTKGKLSFYCHGQGSIAAITDLEALRLSALKSMPIINIDWLDSSSNWEKLWNPCTVLAPLKEKLDTKLNTLIDQMIEQICPSQCNVVVKSPDSFMDNTYLPHRKYKKLPDLNKVVFLPAVKPMDKSVDPLDAEYNLINYLSSNVRGSINGKKRFARNQKADAEGWMPANI